MKRLYRSESDVKIAGICGGIGEEFGIDGSILRLMVVFGSIVTAVLPVVITYLIGWIILPKGRPMDKENETGKE